MSEAVIVSTARTPIGRAFKGSLISARPDDLAAFAVQTALDKVPGLDVHDIDDLMMGCGQPAGEAGFNIGRAVAVSLGYDFLPGTTVNRYCSSSLQTTRMAFHAIKTGEGDAFISAGVEAVSHFASGMADSATAVNPKFAEAQARTAAVTETGASAWTDPRDAGLVPDVYIAMGQTAENVAEFEDVSREDMDAFAALSQQRACESLENGFWEREITPVTTPDGTVVSRDDGIRPGTTVEALAGLKPAFRPDGTVTAGNACPLNDGAAAVLVMSEEKAERLGLQPRARIIASTVAAIRPEIMGLGPIPAIRAVLETTGMRIEDMDAVEMNEAFAAQVVPCRDELGIDPDKLNINGGAIALGHPFGMTGARIMTTLLNNLDSVEGTLGLESMCVAGGMGQAMIVERLN